MKKNLPILLGIAVAGFLLSIIFRSSYELGYCSSNIVSNIYDVSCHAFYESLGDALIYGSGALAIIFLLLYIFPHAMLAWKKFAIWYLPLAMSLFLFSRDPGSGDFFSPYPETVYQWTAAVYVILSSVIIAWVAIRDKRSTANNEAGSLIKNRFMQAVWYLYLAWLLWSAFRFLY